MYNDIGDVGGVVSHVGHIVAGEGAEDAGPLRGSHEPAVVALLHHVHNVSLVQLHLVDQDRKKTNEKATSSSFCGL